MKRGFLAVENDISGALCDGGRERALRILKEKYDGTNEPRARSINYRWTGLFTGFYLLVRAADSSIAAHRNRATQLLPTFEPVRI